jgi:phosphoribosylglycinamide formyltransferase-1
MNPDNERLVSEAIQPDLTEAADHPYRVGEPVVPGRFRWRGEEYVVAAVVESWKELSEGSRWMPDRYVRRHWYRVLTADGTEMKLYVERRGRGRGRARPGWWLYSVIQK